MYIALATVIDGLEAYMDKLDIYANCLMGLSDTYDAGMRQIMLVDPLPTMHRVFAMLSTVDKKATAAERDF